MPTLYRTARAHALPADAEVHTKDGRPHARIRDGGRWAYYPLTKSGRGYLKLSPVWCADVKDEHGRRRRVRLSPVKAAAQAMLTKLLTEAEEGKAGIRTKLTGAGRLVLSDLLAVYERHKIDRGDTAAHAVRAVQKCRTAFNACGFLTLADLDAAPVERWLAGRRSRPKADGGIGPQTSNHLTAALKAFGNFLVKNDRVLANPFRHLAKLNVEADIRHARRALCPDEFDRLLAAARCGAVRRGMGGGDRAMLYLTAGMTGLRASELASLTPASFALDAATPVVTVEAGYSKRKRRDVVPLHTSLVEALRPFLASKPAGERVWPGQWAANGEAVEFLRPDLGAARAAWLDEAGDPVERSRRESTGYLSYVNAKGEFADFHSLRHRFVTELVNAGVMPKDAKELARHSTITLTMNRYAHATLEGTAAALSRIAAPGAGPRVAPGVAVSAHGGRPVTTIDETVRLPAGVPLRSKMPESTANDGGCGRLKAHDQQASPGAPECPTGSHPDPHPRPVVVDHRGPLTVEVGEVDHVQDGRAVKAVHPGIRHRDEPARLDREVEERLVAADVLDVGGGRPALGGAVGRQFRVHFFGVPAPRPRPHPRLQPGELRDVVPVGRDLQRGEHAQPRPVGAGGVADVPAGRQVDHGVGAVRGDGPRDGVEGGRGGVPEQRRERGEEEPFHWKLRGKVASCERGVTWRRRRGRARRRRSAARPAAAGPAAGRA
jgi:integrase/recombinase XerD